jgi:hypothetical protein
MSGSAKGAGEGRRRLRGRITHGRVGMGGRSPVSYAPPPSTVQTFAVFACPLLAIHVGMGGRLPVHRVCAPASARMIAILDAASWIRRSTRLSGREARLIPDPPESALRRFRAERVEERDQGVGQSSSQAGVPGPARGSFRPLRSSRPGALLGRWLDRIPYALSLPERPAPGAADSPDFQPYSDLQPFAPSVRRNKEALHSRLAA